MKVNDLDQHHEGKKSAYLVLLKYWEHRQLENGEAIKSPMEIRLNVVIFFYKTVGEAPFKRW